MYKGKKKNIYLFQCELTARSKFISVYTFSTLLKFCSIRFCSQQIYIATLEIFSSGDNLVKIGRIHLIGLCSGECLQFCQVHAKMTNGPCWVSTSFVLFLTLHCLCDQAFNHLLLLFLFSNLKLTPACSKVPHVITLEVRFLFSQWPKIPITELGSQRPGHFWVSPQIK